MFVGLFLIRGPLDLIKDKDYLNHCLTTVDKTPQCQLVVKAEYDRFMEGAGK